MRTIFRMLFTGTLGLVSYALFVFVPAGTPNYWQAWVLLAVIATTGWVSSIYFLRTNPEVLERRIPTAESRPFQKVVVSGVFLLGAAMLIVSALDHRFGWSAVPTAMSIVGNILVAIGITIVQVVLVQNSHAAVTVRVEAGQQLVSTGLYGLVRHPMYTCNAFLLVGVPLALGSYWGLIFIVPSVLVFAFRIHDEEALLQEELAGYREYMQKVRYRLVPGVW